MSGVLSLKPSYYEALKRLTLELAGVYLGDNHAFLVETRLTALARQEGYETLTQLIDDLFGQGQTRLAIKVVSYLLERDTYFNAEPKSINTFGEYILPSLYDPHKSQTVRILSFACSSGQEAYSLAIMSHKFTKQNPNMEIEIVGVDYPSPSLERAMEGRYTHFEVQRGLPIRDLIKYFDRVNEDWQVKPFLRESVTFKEFHLLSRLDGLAEFDVALFRNSLAHYSSPAQLRVIRSLSSVIKPNGFLIFGAEETLPQANFGFSVDSNYPNILQKIQAPVDSGLESTVASG